jgi:hypothetical protein
MTSSPPAAVRNESNTVVTLVRRGEPNERPAGYTRMIATEPTGANRGNLFLTWDAGHPEGFPVYRASGIGDRAGQEWTMVGQATGGVGAGGVRMQPSFYELPAEFAGLPQHTLLLTGQSTSIDEQTSNIVIFASNDCGETWRVVSHVDSGGAIVYDPSSDSSTDTIWEPELELIGDKLFCFYSDERYKGDGMLQTIVHRSTRDLDSWSERTLDFGIADRTTRPGMFVAAKNFEQDFALGVMEIVGRPLDPVHILNSTDPAFWGDPSQIGDKLVAGDGTWLSGTPNLTWSRPLGFDQPAVIVTGRFAYDRDGNVVNRALVNQDAGRGEWTSMELPIATNGDPSSDVLAGYSQTLLVTRDGRRLVQATTVPNDIGTTDVVVASKPFRGFDA